MLVDWGLELEDKSLGGAWRKYRVKVVSLVVVVIILIICLSIFRVFGRKVGYKTWIVGTAGNCLMRVETLNGGLFNISCYHDLDDFTAEELDAWRFQAGVADNVHGVYYGAFKYRPKGSTQFKLGIAQLDLYNGEHLNTSLLEDHILNFTQIQLVPETFVTPPQLFGMALYKNESGDIVQGLARFTWGSKPKWEILVDWPDAPPPNSCCEEEAGKLVCFNQAALETTSKLNMYFYPHCKKLYEWNTRTLETHHVPFEYITSVIAYYPRIESILSGSLLPVVDVPGARNSDLAVIHNDYLKGTNILKNEHRVALETSIDSYNGIVYLLLGDTKISASGKIYADSLRLYAIDVLVTGSFKIISTTDLASDVIYPDNLMNLCFQRLAESQDG